MSFKSALLLVALFASPAFADEGLTTVGAGRIARSAAHTQKLVHMDGGIGGSANIVGTGVNVVATSAVTQGASSTVAVDRCPSYVSAGMGVFDATKTLANTPIGTVSSCSGTTLKLNAANSHAISANDVLWIAQPLSSTDTCNAILSYTVRGVYESTASGGGAWLSYTGLASYPKQGFLATDVLWNPKLEPDLRRS